MLDKVWQNVVYCVQIQGKGEKQNGKKHNEVRPQPNKGREWQIHLP